jgi:hypothetical protein
VERGHEVLRMRHLVDVGRAHRVVSVTVCQGITVCQGLLFVRDYYLPGITLYQGLLDTIYLSGYRVQTHWGFFDLFAGATTPILNVWRCLVGKVKGATKTLHPGWSVN